MNWDADPTGIITGTLLHSWLPLWQQELNERDAAPFSSYFWFMLQHKPEPILSELCYELQ